MALTAEQIAEARSEGYSDAEILEHYAKTAGIDVAGARKEGYSNSEILSHISGAEVAPEPEVQAEPSALTNPALSGALGAGAGAAYSAKTIPVKAAKAFGNAVASRIPVQAPATPSPSTYTTPAGIKVEQTPGGMHPGAVGNAQFNVEQELANRLHENVPPGFETKGTSRILRPIGMEEPVAALDGRAPGRGGSILSQKRAEGWPIVRETTQAMKSAMPAVGGTVRGIATSNPVAGAMAGYNLQDAMNRYREGDVTGTTIGGAGTAASLMPKMKGRAGLIKPLVGMGAAGINALRDKLEGKAEGGVVAPHLEHMRKGGTVQNFKDGKAVVAETIFKGAKSLLTPKEKEIVRASQVLGNHEGSYLGLTQSDNFGVHGGRMGGNQFPSFQQTSPKHAKDRVVWMNDSQKHADDLVKNTYNKDKPVIWSTYLGAPDQLKSNKTVTQNVYDEFLKNARTPEEYAAINNRIATLTKGKDKPLVFQQPFDIRDKFAVQELGMDTFERRGALASLLGTGEGTRKGKQYMGMPTYEDILASHRDPLTEGASTSSVGTRLFKVDDAPSQFSREYHPDYNWTVHGEDQGVSFKPVPQNVIVPDWYNAYKARFPNKDPHGNAWFSYNKTPQLITEDYLRSLEAAGHAEGGSIKNMAAGKLTGGLSMMPKKQVEDMQRKEQAYNYFSNRPAYQKAEMIGEALSDVPELAASFHPAYGLGYAGSALYDAMANTGDYGNAAMETVFNAPGILKPIGAGIKAAAPMMRQAMPYVGGLGALGAADAAEAGQGSKLKQIIGGAMDQYAPKAARPLPGDPYNAQGPWMRDYQQAVPAQPQVPGERFDQHVWDQIREKHRNAQNATDYMMGRTGPNPRQPIQYMGKYRSMTPKDYSEAERREIETIKMLRKLREME